MTKYLLIHYNLIQILFKELDNTYSKYMYESLIFKINYFQNQLV